MLYKFFFWLGKIKIIVKNVKYAFQLARSRIFVPLKGMYRMDGHLLGHVWQRSLPRNPRHFPCFCRLLMFGWERILRGMTCKIL